MIAGVICALLLAGFCSVLVYDSFSPWPAALQALAQYGPSYHFCVGISSKSYAETSGTERSFSSNRQRAFALVRARNSSPLLVAVSQDQSGKVTVVDTAFGFWAWIVLVSGLGLGTWRFLLRPFLRGRTDRRTTNPAGAVDGGIRFQSNAQRLHPAATDQHR
jgi:hypothetical protein